MVGGGRGSQIGYIHRSAALRDFNFDLIAGAFDIDPARGEDFGKNLHVAPERCYPDYQTMFEAEGKREDGIQAVSIATPNFMHYEIAKAALKAGLHVYCEKPLCFTTEQTKELEQLVKKSGKVMFVSYGYSGHQMIEQAREMIANGDLGKIRMLLIVRQTQLARRFIVPGIMLRSVMITTRCGGRPSLQPLRKGIIMARFPLKWRIR